MKRLALLVVLLGAPAGASEEPLASLGCGVVSEAPAFSAAARAAAEERLVVLALGSSSTAGVGASAPERAYPAQAARRLEAALAPVAVAVIASGVGGETAEGALARLPAALAASGAALLAWQVGANDALSGVDPDALAGRVRAGIAAARAAGVDVVLIDPQWTSSDGAAFLTVAARLAEVAAEAGVGLVRRAERMRAAPTPERLLAADGLHMNDLGHACLGADLAATILSGLR